MQLLKHYDFGLYIAGLNIFAYSIALVHMISTYIYQFRSDSENTQQRSDTRNEFYSTFYKTLLIIFTVMMIITSVNLLIGLIKKSISLIISWLVMSFCVVIYQALIILDQTVFYLAYGYTMFSPLGFLGLCIIFGLQIICIRKILKFTLNLYRNKMLQSENHPPAKNSACTYNYAGNLTEDDSAILTPLNADHYTKFNSLDLNKFEI